MIPRHSFAGLAALLGLAVSAPGAGATEYFASPDETRTTQDCLTEATACSLIRATGQVPNGFLGPGGPSGKHTLTILPGRYDAADFPYANAPFRFRVPAGAIVRGKPGAAKPVIALPDPGNFDPTVDLEAGGTLRDVVVDCASDVCVSAEGDADAGLGPNPAVVERVRITSADSPGDDETLGLGLNETTRVFNVDVEHTAPTGEAISVNHDLTTETAPKLAGVTATSTNGTAIAIAGGRMGQSTTLEFNLVNSVFRGTIDLSAKSDAFNSGPPPGFVPNPILVKLANSVVRSGGSRVVTGPVTFSETGTIAPAGLQLGADRSPLAGSPLIDAGIADAELGTLDLLGNPRVGGSLPDIGAYEFAAPTTTPPTGGGETPGGGTTTPPATNPAPISAPAPTPDKTAPTPTVKTSKSIKRSKLSKKPGLAVSVSVDEAVASIKVQLLSITKPKGKGKKPVEKELASASSKTGGPTFTFALKPKASKIPAGKPKLTLRTTVTDVAGNTRVVDQTVKVS